MTSIPRGFSSVMARRVEADSAVSRPSGACIWVRSDDDWYVEPEWVSARLFEAEQFDGTIWDPACGIGTIVQSAKRAGISAWGSDLVDRRGGYATGDFLTWDASARADNIVTNPPFDIARRFAEQACRLALRKSAIVFPTARLNAARWLRDLPLRRVWLLTPRPSMPPGSMAGMKPGGGKMDFCWLVFGPGTGAPEIRWLHRDGEVAE